MEDQLAFKLFVESFIIEKKIIQNYSSVFIRIYLEKQNKIKELSIQDINIIDARYCPDYSGF